MIHALIMKQQYDCFMIAYVIDTIASYRPACTLTNGPFKNAYGKKKCLWYRVLYSYS